MGKPINSKNVLTLIGMRGDTFISLSLLDQILYQKLFLEMKIEINNDNLTSRQAHWVFLLGGSKNTAD